MRRWRPQPVGASVHEVEDCSQLIDLTDLPPMSMGDVLNALATTYYGELPMIAKGPQGEGLIHVEAPNAPYVTLDLRGGPMFVRLFQVQGIKLTNSDESQAAAMGLQYGKLTLAATDAASLCQVPAAGDAGLDALLAQCAADGLSDSGIDLSGNAYAPSAIGNLVVSGASNPALDGLYVASGEDGGTPPMPYWIKDGGTASITHEPLMGQWLIWDGDLHANTASGGIEDVLGEWSDAGLTVALETTRGGMWWVYYLAGVNVTITLPA